MAAGAATLSPALLATWSSLAAEKDAGKAPYTTWSDYGGSPDSMQYSALAQINRDNVGRLELAWSYRIPAAGFRSAFGPLVIDGVMYVVGKEKAVGRAIVALDAATGRPLWSRPVQGAPTSRGLTCWESRDRSDRRLIFSTEEYLYEIDARTGASIGSFGEGGRVSLRDGVPRGKEAQWIQSHTPGRVFENLLILGSGTGEAYDAPPGDIRAFDVLTGRIVWTFHTIPRAGEFGYDTWPEGAWSRGGGANAWGEISLDEKRGIAYFPLGSPTYDFYGANRKGANLFGNCVLALDARTGKRLWHFQTVHHDLWDYDLAAAPKLLTVRHGGKDVDVVAQATKSGFLFVLNRETGEPLWPVEERPVPPSDVPGEHSWPTQPFPTKPPPFSRQSFTADDLNPHLEPAERSRLQELLRGWRNEGLFTPPSLRGSVTMPGHWGGANWGATAADPRTGMLYVRTLDLPVSNRLTQDVPLEWREGGDPRARSRGLYVDNCAACHGPVATLQTALATLGAEGFRKIVREGQGPMPGSPEIPAEEVDKLFQWMTTLPARPAPSAAQPSTPPAPYVEGKTRYFGQYANVISAERSQPAIRGPWSELVAYDLNEGTIRWRSPLGTVPSLAAKGIKDTGSYGHTRSAPVVTAGGLIFAASGADRTVRAYDSDNGRVVWERELEASPQGIPAVYEVDGRQYVVFFTTARSGTDGISKRGDYAAQGYYAFALPKADAAGVAARPASGRRSRTPEAYRRGSAESPIWFGWSISVPSAALGQGTLLDAAAKAAELEVLQIEGSALEPAGPEERAAVARRLRELAVRMSVYRAPTFGADEGARRKLFELARDLGVHTIVAQAEPAWLPAIDALATEFDIRVALPTGGPQDPLPALEGHSKRIGLSADIGDWMQAGISPVDGLARVKDRLLALTLRDRDTLGAGGRDVPLGTGVAGVESLLVEVHRLGIKPLSITVAAPASPGPPRDRARDGVVASLHALDKALHQAMIVRVNQEARSPTGAIRGPDQLPSEVREAILAAIPQQAPAKPKRRRRLLVFDLNMARSHATIPHANLMLERLGRTTGAYEPVFSNDLDNLKWDRIRQFDAVFLNNVVGMVFADPQVREGLLRFVREGGGLGGIHGSSYASQDWPEFSEMLGAGPGPHRIERQTVKVDDPASPLTAPFAGKGFELTDEFYRFFSDGPYSRRKVRVLLSMDNARSDMAAFGSTCGACARADGDYALSWIRTHGKGRVFYTSLGHTPALFTTPSLVQHVLAGIQFILGDLRADATPSAAR